MTNNIWSILKIVYKLIMLSVAIIFFNSAYASVLTNIWHETHEILGKIWS